MEICSLTSGSVLSRGPEDSAGFTQRGHLRGLMSASSRQTKALHELPRTSSADRSETSSQGAPDKADCCTLQLAALMAGMNKKNLIH